MSTTHVAGPVVEFKKADRFIQRCMVCGEALIKMIPSRVVFAAVGPLAGEVSKLSHWGIGRLVRIDGNYHSDVGDFEKDPLPDDFCLSLVEM